MITVFLRAAPVAALLALAAPAAALAAPTILSGAQNPTQVAAHGSTVMWSDINPATGNYRLMKSIGGAPGSPVGVPELDREEQPGPFDLDLGTSRSGSLQAVYFRAGILYRLAVASGRETRLESISLGGTANHSPTIDRGRIAFIHGERRTDTLRYTASANRKPRILRRGSFNDVELGPKHVVYTDYATLSTGDRTRVRIRNIRTGADRVLYTARSGGANAAGVTRPTFSTDGRHVFWARTNTGSGTGNRIVRYALRTGRLSYAAGNPRYATSAWAGGALGMVVSTTLDAKRNEGCTEPARTYCSVFATGPLTFGLRP